MSTATRSLPRWRPPPPPTPRILHFPRRPRRKTPKPTAGKPLPEHRRHQKGKLEELFHEERSFSRSVPIVLLNAGGECERRERVVEEEGVVLERESGVLEERESGVLEERETVVEVEMLRAECKFLRMEREVALKKLERRRVQMETTLRSAVHTLVSGRKKICEGKSVGMILDKEIEDLAEKLEELQRSSGRRDFEVQTCSNFDKQTWLLQRRLEQLRGISDKKCVKEIQEMAETSLSINTTCRVNESFTSNRQRSKFTDVEVLRRKMEGLSKGKLLERMKEEYGSMLSTANSSVASSASSSKRIEFPDLCSTSLRQPNQETVSQEEAACSGRCKAIVRRIVAQVQAETEQWAQMQDMLGQVREEMEELQASRDFWEDRALNSDDQIQSVRSSVKEWKQKALSSEAKASKLQAQISVLSVELEKLRKDQNTEVMRTKSLPPTHPDSQNEKEKRVLICRLKENHHTSSSGGKQQEVFNEGRRKAHSSSSGLLAPKRSPFRDIGNLSPAMRQISNAIFPLHCPEPSNREENF